MINQVKMYMIYEAIIDSLPLTKELLTSYGIDNDEINNLIVSNTLKQTKTDEYELVSIKGLITYSIKLVNRNLFDRALECLNLCHELEPTNREVALQLLQISVKTKKYQHAWESFEWLENTQDRAMQKDNNLYLYLLSIVSNYPEEYQERIIKMQHDDVTLISADNSSHQNIDKQNQMRIAVLQNKFHSAITLFNTYLEKNMEDQTEKNLIKDLLTQAEEVERRKIAVLLNYIEFKDYKSIVSFIEKQRKKGKVSLYYGFIYYIARNILIISQTKEVPEITITETSNLKEALLGNNYQLALRINNIRARELSENQEKNIVTILLKDIIELINKIKQEESQRQASLDNITSLLSQGNDNEAIKLIEEFLKSIKKSEYQFIVLNLIKINSLEGNQEFTSVKKILTSISKPNYEFNIETYIKNFHDSIHQNNFDIARAYLDIISKSISLVKDPESAEELKTKISSLSNTLEQNIQERNSLLSYLETLKDPNIPFIVLTGIHKEQRHRMINIAKSIKELSISDRGNKEPRILILRHVEQIQIAEDPNKLSSEGMKAYLEGNYQLSIELHLRLLKSVNDIKPRLCTILGLSYLHIGNNDLAIKYLTLANSLNGNKQNKCYLSNKLITSLTESSDETNAPKISSCIEKFTSKLTDYDMEQLTEIAYYIKENNISLESAIASFRLTEEQILLIKLIQVRDYYTEANYQQGDKLFQEVERSKGKSEMVFSMLNEIRKNRKFYKNRVGAHKRSLSPNNQ